jgi:hypothetical protein
VPSSGLSNAPVTSPLTKSLALFFAQQTDLVDRELESIVRCMLGSRTDVARRRDTVLLSTGCYVTLETIAPLSDDPSVSLP